MHLDIWSRRHGWRVEDLIWKIVEEETTIRTVSTLDGYIILIVLFITILSPTVIGGQTVVLNIFSKTVRSLLHEHSKICCSACAQFFV